MMVTYLSETPGSYLTWELHSQTAKREGWKKFTSKIKHPSDVSKLIKSFNNSKNNALGLLKKQRWQLLR